MITIRPRHTRPDNNHAIVPDFIAAVCAGHWLNYADGDTAKTNRKVMIGLYRGFSVLAIDVHDVGGLVDWLVYLGEVSIAIEIKSSEAERNNLTASEVAFRAVWPGTLFKVAVNMDELGDLFALAADMADGWEDA
jgi:hypothetical protein